MVKETSQEHYNRHSAYKLQRCAKEGMLFNFVISSAGGKVVLEEWEILMNLIWYF